MSLYLAVAADGAETVCVLAEETRVLARVTGEPVRWTAQEADEARRRLQRVLTEAGARAGVPLYLVTRACVGVEGMGAPGARAWAEETLRELIPGELILVSAEEMSLDAAFGRGPGVLVMAGARSRVVGRCGDGARFVAGGWGPMLGDEGSSHWIGVEGVRSALRALDRGVGSVLLKEVGARWGTQGVSALISRANSWPSPDFGALAEVVGRAAAAGDGLASSVLERAGKALAAQVSTVLFRMREAHCATTDGQRVAFAGAVLERMPTVRIAMEKALVGLHPQAVVDERGTDPVGGALARARRES